MTKISTVLVSLAFAASLFVLAQNAYAFSSANLVINTMKTFCSKSHPLPTAYAVNISQTVGNYHSEIHIKSGLAGGYAEEKNLTLPSSKNPVRSAGGSGAFGRSIAEQVGQFTCIDMGLTPAKR